MGNEPLTLLALALICSGCLVALLVVLGVLFPQHVQRSSRTAAQSPGRSFWIGAVNVLFFGALALALLSSVVPLLQAVGVIIAAAVIAAMAIGLGGMVQLAGERILPTASPLRRTAWSALIVVAACLTPYVGWLLLFPYLVFRGVGGWLLGSLRERREKRIPQSE